MCWDSARGELVLVPQMDFYFLFSFFFSCLTFNSQLLGSANLGAQAWSLVPCGVPAQSPGRSWDVQERWRGFGAPGLGGRAAAWNRASSLHPHQALPPSRLGEVGVCGARFCVKGEVWNSLPKANKIARRSADTSEIPRFSPKERGRKLFHLCMLIRLPDVLVAKQLSPV